jgi:hypothetical protein
MFSFSPNGVALTGAELGIQDCVPLMRSAEQRHGIPARLLQAISYIESGRSDRKNGDKVAWPWTINAEGDGFVFHSKTEAVQRVQALKQQGVQSIDVGCMQVNLFHHPAAFNNLEQAFDPATNIDYAARFLKSLQQETGSWAQAVAYYHSRNEVRNSGYQRKVLAAWQKTRPDGSSGSPRKNDVEAPAALTSRANFKPAVTAANFSAPTITARGSRLNEVRPNQPAFTIGQYYGAGQLRMPTSPAAANDTELAEAKLISTNQRLAQPIALRSTMPVRPMPLRFTPTVKR